ncbi:hypothetical protein QYE76_050607 [Lolium multiflorum]|uniref:Uncharacterized protein n=1 Tax=Lolium multiflorum TaxID=4521 RepID=A0AAD8SS77_LOLMU|nr:hypothetical protein QYE76_050607 [Lolium multiflorum]
MSSPPSRHCCHSRCPTRPDQVESAVAHKVVDKSRAIDVASESYVEKFNDASVDIDSPPLVDYDDMEEGLEGDEFGEDEDVGGDEEDDLEGIEEGEFDGTVAKAKGRAIRTDNYIGFEDVILIRVWEGVSMDTVTGTDQTSKRYWQRIKELLVMKTLEAKKDMMETKNKEKEEKWSMLREYAKRKADIEERRARAKENRAMAELIVAENATMMINPNEMDEFRLEWWTNAKMDILTRRREVARVVMVAMNA